MSNCLVVSLPVTINDAELPRLGKLRIHTDKNTQGTNYSMTVRSTVKAAATVVGSYFTSEDGTADYGQEMNIPANTMTTFYVANDDADVFIEKQQLTRIGPFDPVQVRGNVSFDLKEVKNISTLVSISANVSGVYGNTADLPSNIAYADLSGTNIEGNIEGLVLPNLTHISLRNSGVYGDVSSFANSPNLADLNLSLTKATGNLSSLSDLSLQNLDISDTKIEGDLSDLENMTGMKSLVLSKYITGDLSSLSNMTQFSGTLDIHNCDSITGELSDVSALVGATYLYFTGQKITGDLYDIRNLTSLTNISLGGCECTGDVASLVNMESISFISFTGEKNEMYGDLSALPASLARLTAGSESEFTWEGTRSSEAKIISMKNVRLGQYVDAMLINQADCVAATNKEMRVYGERTSASDSAILELNEKGYTIFVNDEEVVVESE